MKKFSEHSGLLLWAAVSAAIITAGGWLIYAFSWRTTGSATWSAIVQGCLNILEPFQGYPMLAIAVLVGALLVTGLAAAVIRTAKRLSLNRVFGKGGYAVLDSLTITDDRLERAMDNMEAKVGFRPNALLVQSENPVCLVYGLLKPGLIVSTRVLDELTPDELESAVMHEATHIIRRDPLRRVVAEMIADFLFFIPVFRSLAGRVAFAQELEADRFSGRITGRPDVLAGAILKLAVRHDIGIAAALNENWISERVRRLLGLPEKTKVRVSVLSIIVSFVMVAGLIVGPYAVAGETVVARSGNDCFKQCVQAGVHNSIEECKVKCGHK